MKYIAIVHKNKETGVAVTLPDFPGCLCTAATVSEVEAEAQRAVERFGENEAFAPPSPISFEQVLERPEAKGALLMLIDISFDFLDERIVAMNISMPAYMRERIDRAAKAKGMTRSGYLMQAARAFGA